LKVQDFTYLATEFARNFGEKDLCFFSAPGRTEVCGNHTDHQQGRVLAAAVNLDARAATAPNDENICRIISGNYSPVVVDLSDLSPREDEKNSSNGLVRGIAEYFVKNGRKIGGFDAVSENLVMGGSGLSSSAAFEVLVATIFGRLYGEVSPEFCAMAGQYAENVHFGKPCGLMDQMVSAVGGFVTIDFRDPENPSVRQLNVDFKSYGHSLCIISTGGSHDNLTEEYAAIPREMCAVAALLGVEKLGYADERKFYAELPSIRRKSSDRAVLRAMHFFSDNRRVALETEALENGNFDEFLHLVRESGRSSRELLQNIVPTGAVENQPVALALACCERLLAGRGACRVHGGGFAGTIQAFVPNTAVSAFIAEMEKFTGAGSCQLLQIRAEGGVEIA